MFMSVLAILVALGGAFASAYPKSDRIVETPNRYDESAEELCEVCEPDDEASNCTISSTDFGRCQCTVSNNSQDAKNESCNELWKIAPDDE